MFKFTKNRLLLFYELLFTLCIIGDTIIMYSYFSGPQLPIKSYLNKYLIIFEYSSFKVL